MKMNYNKAFTLAETLTTLMIIGIIASMTIPVLTSGVDRIKTQTTLKKMYAAMNINIQTVLGRDAVETLSDLRAWGEEGGPHNGVLANPDYFNVQSICADCFAQNKRDANGDEIESVLLPHPMDSGAEGAPALEEVRDPSNGNVIQDARAAIDATNANFTTYILRDNTWAAIYDFEGNCTQVGYVTSEGTAVNLCSIVVFDTNAQRGPNSPGEDRFAYYVADTPVDNSYLIPIGYRGADDATNNGSIYNNAGLVTSAIGDGNCNEGTVTGYNCTAQMMMRGWRLENR